MNKKLNIPLTLICSLSLVACGPTPSGQNSPTPVNNAQAGETAITVPENEAEQSAASDETSSSPAMPVASATPVSVPTPSPDPQLPPPQENNLSLNLSSERTSFTAVGQSENLQAQLLDAEGNTQELTETIRWSSSDEAIFTVDAQGKVQVKKAEGSAIISAQIDALDLIAQIKLEVAPQVTITPSSGGGGGGGGGGSSSASSGSSSATATSESSSETNTANDDATEAVTENIQSNPDGGPTITWVNRSSASVGDTLLIVGTGLDETTAVNINGAAAEFKIVDTAMISVVVPDAAASSGNIQVTNPQGSFTLGVVFTVTSSAD